MARTILIDCEGLESEEKKKKKKKKSILDHTKLPWGGWGLCTLWRWRLFSHSPVGPVKKFCFRNWFAHSDQTAAEEPSKKWVVRRHRKMGRGPLGGRLTFVKVSTKLDIHTLLTGSAAGPLGWVRGRSGPSGIEEIQQNQTSKGLSWATMQVAVGLWVGMYGYFSLSTNRKARELC